MNHSKSSSKSNTISISAWRSIQHKHKPTRRRSRSAPVTYSVFVAVVVVVTVCTGPTSPVIVSPPEAVHHVVAVALGTYTVVYGTSGSPSQTALSAQQPMWFSGPP
ncbi:hypothetical protein KCV05_g6527, partial [Aureobasidium melanogenum]